MTNKVDRLKRNIEYFKSIACYDSQAHLMIKRLEKKLKELEKENNG